MRHDHFLRHQIPCSMLVLFCLCFCGTATAEETLDEILADYEIVERYAENFEDEVPLQMEEELLDDTGKRAKEPAPETEWVAEGNPEIRVEDGRIFMKNRDHGVLWNTRIFPDNYLVEWDFQPSVQNGLAIIFFSMTAAENGGSVFQTFMPVRKGIFGNYIRKSSGVNGYHISYYAHQPNDGSVRDTTNMRKHFRSKDWGFRMVATGDNPLAKDWSPGPHRLRLVKIGPRIILEINGQINIDFTDDQEKHGGPHGGGQIGLRQMGHTEEASYGYFRVFELEPAKRTK